MSLVLTTFGGKTPRNLTSFTRPFLAGKHAWAGDETNPTLPLSSYIMHKQSMKHILPEKGRPSMHTV